MQLADATDEGWGCNIFQMHKAETAGYGVVPNAAFPGAFVAAGHDLVRRSTLLLHHPAQ